MGQSGLGLVRSLVCDELNHFGDVWLCTVVYRLGKETGRSQVFSRFVALLFRELLKASRTKTGLKKGMEHTVLPYVCIQF